MSWRQLLLSAVQQPSCEVPRMYRDKGQGRKAENSGRKGLHELVFQNSSQAHHLVETYVNMSACDWARD